MVITRLLTLSSCLLPFSISLASMSSLRASRALFLDVPLDRLARVSLLGRFVFCSSCPSSSDVGGVDFWELGKLLSWGVDKGVFTEEGEVVLPFCFALEPPIALRVMRAEGELSDTQN